MELAGAPLVAGWLWPARLWRAASWPAICRPSCMWATWPAHTGAAAGADAAGMAFRPAGTALLARVTVGLSAGQWLPSLEMARLVAARSAHLRRVFQGLRQARALGSAAAQRGAVVALVCGCHPVGVGAAESGAGGAATPTGREARGAPRARSQVIFWIAVVGLALRCL